MRAEQAVDDVAESLPSQGFEQQGTAGPGLRRLVGSMSLHQIEGMVAVVIIVIAEGIRVEFVEGRLGEPSGEDEEARDGGGGDGDGFVGGCVYGRG